MVNSTTFWRRLDSSRRVRLIFAHCRFLSPEPTASIGGFFSGKKKNEPGDDLVEPLLATLQPILTQMPVVALLWYVVRYFMAVIRDERVQCNDREARRDVDVTKAFRESAESTRAAVDRNAAAIQGLERAINDLRLTMK